MFAFTSVFDLFTHLTQKGLRQHRTILIAQMRRQIFRQTNQKGAGEMDFRQGILVQYDGKDASSCVIKATAANCAVLP